MFKELGYYICNGIEFESKIAAMTYAQATKLPVKWHFNDEVFNSYPWHIEPALSLDELYNKRAREIREQHDYVVLCYSGGSDSHNVLESFIRQGLHIDEIITNWALDIAEPFTVLDKSQTDTWNHNAEFKLHTADRLNYIRNVIPKTKITMIDTSKTLIETFLNAKDASWVKTKKEVLNATGSSQYNYTYFSEIRKRFDKDRKIAIVIGTDKPKLKLINNRLHLYFVDKAANMVSIQDHIAEYPNATPVFFYWAPDSCDILAKQSHVVLKWLRANPQHQPAWASNDPVVTRRVHEALLKTVIYSTWNPEWFQVVKSLEDWDSELDYWFTRGWQGTKEYDIWKSGIDYVAKRIPDFLTRNPDKSIKGTKVCTSQNYFIGTL